MEIYFTFFDDFLRNKIVWGVNEFWEDLTQILDFNIWKMKLKLSITLLYWTFFGSYSIILKKAFNCVEHTLIKLNDRFIFFIVQLFAATVNVCQSHHFQQ
jgi:hypothetical protein